MAADKSRIDELRRRVEKDPASIAFAQLAEEYRRAGDYDEAVRVCQAGLARHPGYFSARVTLGLAFMEMGRLEEAQAELKSVLSAAPDNLAAVRALAEMHERISGLPETPDVETAAHDPGTDPDPADFHIDTFDPAHVNAAPAGADFVLDAGAEDANTAVAPDNTSLDLPIAEAPPATADPVLEDLEQWLEAIRADREAGKENE